MRRKHVIVLLLAAATLLAFGRSLSNQFLTFDDEPLIYANPHLNPPDAAGLAWQWSNPYWFMYTPVTSTAWWAIAQIHGAHDPFCFHAANLIVHFVAGWLCFLILRLLIQSDWAAAAGAVLFLVHPLQAEPVAWATGMKDLLSGCLALAAIWAYLRFLQSRRGLTYLLATWLFVLALLAKPSTVVVPLICMAIEVIWLGGSWRRAAAWLAPWAIPAVAIAVVAGRVQPAVGGPIWTRPLVAGDALAFYLAKLVFPVNLGIDYGRTTEMVVQSHPLNWLVPVAAAVLIFIFRRNRAILAGATIFGLALLPVLGLKPFKFQLYSTVADRYVYLAMLGPALVAAALLKQRPKATLVAVVILVLLAVKSMIQSTYWFDSETLYRHAIETNPTSLLAHNNLGVVLADRGDVDGAIGQYLVVSQLDPTDVPACRYVADAEASKLRTNPSDQQATQILREMQDRLARLTSQPKTRPGGF
jgi:hypothetical protein